MCHPFDILLIGKARQRICLAAASLAAISRPSPTTFNSGIRCGWCSALSRLCTRLVMKTVLPARLKPVTASEAVEPLAISARSATLESQSESVAPARSNFDILESPFRARTPQI
jgi:hypothetical protein